MQALWKIHGKAPPTIFEMNIKDQARKKYLSDHAFRGHSDTETIIELFRKMQEKMLHENSNAIY